MILFHRHTWSGTTEFRLSNACNVLLFVISRSLMITKGETDLDKIAVRFRHLFQDKFHLSGREAHDVENGEAVIDVLYRVLASHFGNDHVDI